MTYIRWIRHVTSRKNIAGVGLQAQHASLGLQAAYDEARLPAYIHISDNTPRYTLCCTGDCIMDHISSWVHTAAIALIL